jgi:hypothetical protein
MAQRLFSMRRQGLEWSNWYIIDTDWYRFIVRDEASFLYLSGDDIIILRRFIQRRILKNGNNLIKMHNAEICNDTIRIYIGAVAERFRI